MSTLIEIGRFIREKFHWSLWVLAPILGMLALVGVMLENVIAGLATLNDNLVSVLPMISDGAESLSAYYVVANTFLPVTEGFILLGLQLSLAVVALAIRVIKAFIPTIA